MAGARGPLLVIDNVTKRFGERLVLRKVSITIDRPMLYGLLGPNGAGKTTLLNIVMGVMDPDEGRIEILGMSPRSPEARSIVGYCPQEPALDDLLTGRENIAFYARLYGVSPRKALENISEVIDALELKNYLNMKVGKYSGGMKKKLSLAISLVNEPKILVLDEPTTGLDPEARRRVWSILEKLKRDKLILLTTHYMEEADKLSDIVGIINEGSIIAEGEPEELKKRYGPRAKIVVQLYGEPPRSLVEKLGKTYEAVYADKSFIHIHLEDPESSLPNIVKEVLSADVKIDSIRISKPTLEDVFLRLTGRRLSE